MLKTLTLFNIHVLKAGNPQRIMVELEVEGSRSAYTCLHMQEAMAFFLCGANCLNVKEVRHFTLISMYWGTDSMSYRI